MREEIICPFFGVKDSLCKVGCDYVSGREADKIVKTCILSFDRCLRYVELNEDLEKGFSIKEKFQNFIKIF